MSYAKDVSCKEAWESLAGEEPAALVDVRTTHEWATIGTPDLTSVSKQAIFAEWQMFPSMQVNPEFVKIVDDQLKSLGISKENPVFFLCRSGARSQAAASALTAMGYTKACNIVAGFEGAPDQNGIRSNIDGWIHDGLPWKQE